MLSWQVGRVKITRIVEMDLPVPAMVIPQATAGELRRSAWLYPHFVSEDDATLYLSVHALLVEAPGLKLVVDTCVGNDRPREITGGRRWRRSCSTVASRGPGREMIFFASTVAVNRFTTGPLPIFRIIPASGSPLSVNIAFQVRP